MIARQNLILGVMELREKLVGLFLGHGAEGKETHLCRVVKRHNTLFVGSLRAKFNKQYMWVICCRKGNIHDIMRETAVPKCFGIIR